MYIYILFYWEPSLTIKVTDENIEPSPTIKVIGLQ